ncbi:hypothetical protein [Clostridium sp. DJ247]|uniref:hypothetical protein n=1 Tax=Clostridium sp. DJ247 TaxID=2726188 RepID=UPI00162A6506|nr:hypothetical protein [Clostridium sp. DJ247]MBC2581033.1 hypothetical protein [Clostridium sp. DJ247]
MQKTKGSDRDMMWSTPSVTESLGLSTSAGLTSESNPGYDGLSGNIPLLPNYNDSSKSSKNSFLEPEED